MKPFIYIVPEMAACMFALVGCGLWDTGDGGAHHAANTHADHDEHDEHAGHAEHADHEAHGAPDAHAEHDEHDAHGHSHGETGVDLKRPVAELFEDRCEHNMKTYACDECRYEVGVVQVPGRLFDEKLVTTAKVASRALTAALRLTGEIQFDDRRVTHVSTQVGGIIRKVHVTLGDKVTAGQPLVELESVEVGNARAEYQEALALERLARQNFERVDALQKEGISSQKEVLHAKQEWDGARIRMQATLGTLQRIGTGGGSNASGRLVLKAPNDGRVLEMHAVKGEIAETTDALITIGDNASLWVWADLFEQDYPRVLEQYATGPIDARIYVSAFGDTGFPGVVDYISPSMSERSRTVNVRVAVKNNQNRLLSGMFAEVDLFLTTGDNDGVLSVPSKAILDDEGASFVFVHHKGDYFVRRAVTPGRQFGNYTAIHGDVTAGSDVVADGAFLLKSDVLRAKMGAGCAH
ncbi:MAG: efflux RND transporter periplasmic adaptor subunit [Deltaproteobacteria bacterium]|nr:efflux RND transporter periplasmic adaptor subunit [Deltaproteobacteria bacterium]